MSTPTLFSRVRRAAVVGATTRIGTDRAVSGQFGLNLVYRVGSKSSQKEQK